MCMNTGWSKVWLKIVKMNGCVDIYETCLSLNCSKRVSLSLSLSLSLSVRVRVRVRVCVREEKRREEKRREEKTVHCTISAFLLYIFISDKYICSSRFELN
jgi:hypothetical protein